MKKFNLKSFATGALASAIIMSSLSNASIAKSLKENIEVVYNNIKIVVDNKPVKFNKDSQGNIAEPFIHNGTTYLPVRAVGEALGKDVKWDGTNKTVYIGNVDKGTVLMTDELEPHYSKYFDFYNTKSSHKLNIAGKEYSTGLSSHLGHAKVYYNLNSEYEEIEFDYGPSKGYDYGPGKLLIYMDEELKHTLNVDGTDHVKKAKISVKGVNQLRIETGSGVYIGIGDPVIR